MPGGTQKRKMRLSRARAIVCVVIFFGCGIGLFVRTGWGNFSSMGYKAISAICPLGALETLVAAKTAIPRVVVIAVVVLGLTALVGKVFCSWVCPVPHVSSFFKGGKKKAAEEAEPALGDANSKACSSCSHACSDGCQSLAPVGGKRDGLSVDSRHVVLGGALVSAAVFGFPAFCLICPIGLTFATFVAVWQLFGLHEPTWSLLVFPMVLALELVVFKKWCHRLCPLGALLSLLSQRAPLLRPRVKKGQCLRDKGENCTVCVSVCPEEVDPHSDKIGECTKCGLCVDACPVGAVSFGGCGSSRKAKREAFATEGVSEGGK